MTLWAEDRIHLIGKVGTAPEVKALAGGEMVTFPIEVQTVRFGTDDSGRRSRSEGTAWFRIVVIERRLVFEAKHVRVGEVVSICRTIEGRSYRDGHAAKIIEFIAEELLQPQSRTIL